MYRSKEKATGRCPLCIEIVGWYGVVGIIIPYILASLKVIEFGLVYQAVSFSGCLGVIISSVIKKDYQPAVINGIIGIVALIAISNYIFNYY